MVSRQHEENVFVLPSPINVQLQKLQRSNVFLIFLVSGVSGSENKIIQKVQTEEIKLTIRRNASQYIKFSTILFMFLVFFVQIIYFCKVLFVSINQRTL